MRAVVYLLPISLVGAAACYGSVADGGNETGSSAGDLADVTSTTATTSGDTTDATTGADDPTGGAFPPSSPVALPGRASAIWYSTWYTARDPFFWHAGHGVGASTRFLADVNADGRADAVVFFGSGDLAGNWYVALSTGAGFTNYSQWASGHGTGSTWQGLADVNGDGSADAVAFFVDGQLGGNWYVATSNGAGFNNYSPWISGHGTGSSWQGLADVNGDKTADAVVYFGAGGLAGNWYVATSNGGGFNNYSQWATGHGVGSTWQGLADVSGDGFADAVVYFGAGGLAGNWYVATSNGGGFNNYGQWAAGHGVGSTWQGLGDVDGNGAADALVWFPEGPPACSVEKSSGKWYAAPSSGGGFGGGALWRTQRPTEGGHAPAFLGAADVTGDHTADAVLGFPHGVWTVRRGEGDGDPVTENLWSAWGIDYVPLVDGVPQPYDSADETVIDSHLAMLHGAGFDVLLFDLTNHVQTGFILDRARVVRDRIVAFNQGRPENDRIRFAIAVGGMQFSHNPAELEGEAAFVAANFVLGDEYYRWKGKPLLVSYSGPEDRSAWQAHPDHTQTDQFSVGFAQGEIKDASAAGFFGWGVTQTISDPEVMTVMAGWDNNKCGPIVLRDQGRFYDASWRSLLAARPHLAVVNSFNEYAEETAVAPTITTGALGRLPTKEPWLDYQGVPTTDWYWQMTAQWNFLYRTGCYQPGTYVREVGSPDVYRFVDGSFAYQGVLPAGTPVLEITAGTR